ncbi:GMC family oxidoreductase [Halorarius litoreus]|uniref:GMC family oxidoreductase n=1 Tax=Halorarius litoreus TaxID=2962676 RepID=UPI0020CD99A8|nr:GMC family oxidoreductase [Halorarius litoreus]
MNRHPSSNVDVCVVGAGPAGALVANRLADRGADVVVLEAGPRFDDQDEARMERALRPDVPNHTVWEMGGERDVFSSSGDRFYPLNASRVKGVGGTTNHWQGMVMRLHERDFSGENLGSAWPLDYQDLRPYYLDAERAFGVAGASDNPFAPPREEPHSMPAFPPSYSDSLFAEACEQVGVATHSVPNARNSEAYDGRSPCVGYGTCKPVCASGAKYSADHTIEQAEAKGVRVVDRAPVQRLETDSSGKRVAAAVYATPDGEAHRQEAEVFVLAAGGVEIPRLLLLSASDQHPDGLANSSGLVGRYFADHLFAGMGGVLDEPTRQKHVGFITTESHQFYDDPGQGTREISATDADLAPIKLEFLNYAGPSPVGEALAANEWGDALLTSLDERYGNHVAMGALVGQRPRIENRITLDPSTTDDHGNPVPDVQWSLDARTRRTLERANEIQRAILDALGADIRWAVGPENTGPAFHHTGTARMSDDPAAGVVRPDLRTHDVSNLYLPSAAAFPNPGSMNPTLTIGALALKCADHVTARL